MISRIVSKTARASRITTHAKSLTLFTFNMPSTDPGQVVAGLNLQFVNPHTASIIDHRQDVPAIFILVRAFSLQEHASVQQKKG